MQMFGFRLQIPMAYIPRTESVAKHIHPSEIFQRSTGEQSVFMRKSGMGLELLFALQIARSAARELLFQFPLRRYLAEVSGYLKLVEESKKYIKNKQYDLAARSWENLVQRSMLGAITSVSRNQAKYFADLRQKHQQQLRQLLSAQHRSIHPALANWHPVGDWAWDDGILQALPGKYRPTSIYTGTSDLSNYVLKFEVKNPNPGFSVDLHVAQVPEHPVPLHSFHSTSLDASHPMYHPRSERRAIPLRPYHRRSHFGRYKARHNFSKRSTAKISPQNTRLDFHTEHFAKDRWVPIRIKVEGHRISYWFGLKHYTRTATARNGMFGILVPANAQLLIRNVQIEVPKTQTPTPIIANAPSLQLSLQGTPSATKVGDHVSHLLAIRNRGGLAASNLRVQLRFSKHLEFISANAQPSNIMPRWHKTDRLLTFSPIDALMPKQTLYIRIYTRTIHQGSANAQADISFASMQGEISIHNRIHIASKDDI
jgi:hypothetical protein